MYKEKYLNGTYTALELVNCISQTIGRENKRVLSSCDSLYFQEEIDSPSDEESNKSRCNVCLQDRIENFAPLIGNFAHTGFCEYCAHELMRLKRASAQFNGKKLIA